MQSSYEVIPRGADVAHPPRTETERILVDMWSEVLKRDHVGIYDDFIELGGHSLSATLCLNRITEVFGVTVPLDLFFLEPAHIAEIAGQIDGLRRGGR
jgi:hypothetical protein